MLLAFPWVQMRKQHGWLNFCLICCHHLVTELITMWTKTTTKKRVNICKWCRMMKVRDKRSCWDNEKHTLYRSRFLLATPRPHGVMFALCSSFLLNQTPIYSIIATGERSAALCPVTSKVIFCWLVGWWLSFRFLAFWLPARPTHTNRKWLELEWGVVFR